VAVAPRNAISSEPIRARLLTLSMNVTIDGTPQRFSRRRFQGWYGQARSNGPYRVGAWPGSTVVATVSEGGSQVLPEAEIHKRTTMGSGFSRPRDGPSTVPRIRSRRSGRQPEPGLLISSEIRCEVVSSKSLRPSLDRRVSRGRTLEGSAALHTVITWHLFSPVPGGRVTSEPGKCAGRQCSAFLATVPMSGVLGLHATSFADA
jgi:hypothetical protein